MADDRIEVQIAADASDFTQAMRKASIAAQAGFAELQRASAKAGAAVDKAGKSGKKAGSEGQQATAAWVRSFANLDSAFSASISGMIFGTETWQKAVRRLSQMALTDLVAIAQRQLATWIATDIAMTKATAAGTAARSAAEKTSQSGFFTLIAQALARWLGLESAKTAASASGNAARSASDAAAAAASAVAAVARGMGMIQISAAEAAAAAFADSAELGPEGLAVAPGVAAAAYGVTLGYGTGLGAALFSAAGGAWTVPADMLALVHKQESILPAAIAQPMRDFFAGGASGAGDSYAITIQAIETQTGAQFLANNSGAIAQALARELRNGNAALRSAAK